jgi:UDPglucose--hexose-1-phosphate uridylyltransferase
MKKDHFLNKPHRRYNPLNDKWILISPQRSKRPWKGKVENDQTSTSESYDGSCYLCPGNKRVSGAINEKYEQCFIFDNDFAALEENPADETMDTPLFRAMHVSGQCKVLCYSPDHSKTLPELDIDTIRAVIDAWCDIYTEMEPANEWVQIFENKGEINGCSNPHPHGQVWASNHIPQEAEREDQMQQQHFTENQVPMLLQYAEAEITNEERLVCMNDDWLAVVPYWASWPFETLLMPREHITHMTDLDNTQKTSLAEILKELTTRYDNLFNVSFPYSMGWHCRPANNDPDDHWQMHAHFYPPLLRSATIQKFMVGYELMAETQRDISPEKAAEMLRSVSSKHYKSAN